MGDVYPNAAKLPKGEYNLQLYLRYDPFADAAQIVTKINITNFLHNF